MGFAGKAVTPPVVIPPVVIPPKPSVPPAPTDAITSSSGWYLKNHSIAGSTTTLNALKQNATTGVKSTVSVTPTESEIIAVLLDNRGTNALTQAVLNLIGADVAWTLDIPNRRISYTSTL